jgi:cell division protein FtsQ
MKKTGAKRVSGYDSGLGSAVLTAPEENYASEGDGRKSRRGPAPAGALQRGYREDRYGDSGAEGSYADEAEYVPQRGKVLRFRSLPRSVAGRVVLGVATFAVLAAVGVAFAEVRSYLLYDARFVVASSDDIQITGADHLTRDQILSVFGSDLERNIFRVSLGERQADLERLPWVAHATVMRLLPNVLRVQITERTPVAFVRQGSQIGLVDASGVLLDMPSDAAGDPHYSFPVLTGLTADESGSDRSAKMEVYEQFLHELDGSGQRLTDSVSEVDVADPEDVKALIPSGGSDILVHFGQEKFLQRYQEFEQHLQEWKKQYPKLASADMRYDGQIVLEMQGDGKPVEAGAVEKASVASPAPAIAEPVFDSKPVASVKPAVVKAPAAKVAVAKAPAPKSAAMNVGASKPPVTKAAAVNITAPKTSAAKTVVPKPSAPTSAAVNVAAAKSPVVKPDFSHADMPKAAAPKPVVMNAPATKVAAPKAVATSKLTTTKASAPAVKKAAPKPAAGKAKAGSGMSAANEKVFARLAAEHQAELAKQHKTGTASVAKTAKPGTSRPGTGGSNAKAAVTP